LGGVVQGELHLELQLCGAAGWIVVFHDVSQGGGSAVALSDAASADAYNRTSIRCIWIALFTVWQIVPVLQGWSLLPLTVSAVDRYSPALQIND
jgi:hypothetical protein